MGSFFSQLSYSFGNEDWKTEQQALKIQPQDRVLCITASGDRPLNLLMQECQEMVAIDANPKQNYLLQLKAAAMDELPFEEYLQFLGALPAKRRTLHLNQLSHKMDSNATAFWQQNRSLISKGVLYQGSMERITRHVSVVLKFFRGTKIKKLFAMDDLEEQRQFIRQEWDRKGWRRTVEFILNPYISKLIIKDPGLQDFLGPVKPGVYLYERMNTSLNTCLARENPILSFFLNGKVAKEAYGPYLTQKGTAAIRQNLGCLKIETDNVIHYLEKAPEKSFNCYSLSDVASYMDKASFRRMLEGVIRTAKPGARFCIRQFMSFHDIPEDLEHHFKRDLSLEQLLEKEDRCFVYRFYTGTVVG